MKKINLISIFFVVLILLVTMVSPVMAKPVDSGYAVFQYGPFTDVDGHAWYFNFYDYFDSSPDYTYVQCLDLGVGINSYGEEFTYRGNFNNGTIVFKNTFVNIKIDLSDLTYLDTYGSRKDGSWSFDYYNGPGSIIGTITVGSNVYNFECPVENSIRVIEGHTITK